jgi:hypothetical protein
LVYGNLTNTTATGIIRTLHGAYAAGRDSDYAAFGIIETETSNYNPAAIVWSEYY